MRPRRPSSGPPQTAQRIRLPRGVAVVYEDEDVLVVNKPTGIITADPATGGDGGRRSARAGNTVFDILKEYVRDSRPRQPQAGRSRNAHSRDQGVWIIHRLDKEASGLLVFAKSIRAFNWLKDDLRAKRMGREYIAVVEGLLGKAEQSGTIQTFISEQGRVRPRSSGGPEPSAAKLAVTHFHVISSGEDRTLIRVRLDTGRKNQIRIHFAEKGHPLVGDRRFGAKSDPIERLALHAARLTFTHPARGQTLEFESPPPPAFFRCVGLPPPPQDAETGARLEERPTGAAAADGGTRADPPGPAPATSWDAVAGWYDRLLDEQGNDHYEQVILPGALRLLGPRPGMRVLDLACGQGILGRRLARMGVEVVGVEASPRLVEAAARRARDEGVGSLAEFRVGDARDLGEMPISGMDAVACIMALSNIEPLSPVFAGIARALKPGGRLVWIISHPAFRAPGQTEWGWDADRGRQYRRIDGYLSPGQHPITMNPGKAARGQRPTTTWTFHRPLQTYIDAMSNAGLLVEKLEEWPSLRASTSGPRAAEENRARREIPLFLGVRAVKVPAPV